MPDITFTLYDMANKGFYINIPNYTDENNVECAKKFQRSPSFFNTEILWQTAVELNTHDQCKIHESEFIEHEQNKLTFGTFTIISSAYCFIHNLREIHNVKLQVNMSAEESLLSKVQLTDLHLETILSNCSPKIFEDEPTDGCSASKSSSGCERSDSCYNSKKDKYSDISSISSYQHQSMRDLKFYLQNKSQKMYEKLELKQTKKDPQTSNTFVHQLDLEKNFDQSNLYPKPLQNNSSWDFVTDSSKHCNRMSHPHAKLILNSPAHKESFDMHNHKIRSKHSIKSTVQKNNDHENYLMKYDEAARLEIFKLRQRIKKYTEGPNKFQNNWTKHAQNVQRAPTNILKSREDSKLTHDNINKALPPKETVSESMRQTSVFQRNLSQASHSTAIQRKNRNPTVFETKFGREDTETVRHKFVLQKDLTQSSHSTPIQKKKRNPKVFEKVLETEDNKINKSVQKNLMQLSHSTITQKKKRIPKVFEKNINAEDTETVSCITSTDLSSTSSDQIIRVHSYNKPKTFKFQNMPNAVSLCGKNEISHLKTEVMKPKAENICTKSHLAVTERKAQKMKNDAKKSLCTVQQNNNLETHSVRSKQSHRPIPGERPLYNYDQLSYQASEVFPDLLCELEQRLVSTRRIQRAVKISHPCEKRL